MRTPEEVMADIEHAAAGKLRYPEQLAALLSVASSEEDWKRLLELAFMAKFITKSFDIMKRIGPKGEGYQKLATEFSSNLEKARTLLETIVASKGEAASAIAGRFLVQSPESVERFLDLMHDLSWLKNWEIDHRIG
jgi:hypothetical protein